MQLTMGAVKDPRGEDCWARLHTAVSEACALITLKELAFRLDIAPSYLNEALHEKNSKGFRLSWLPTVLMMTSETSFLSIVGTMARWRGCVIEKRKELTAEERAERLEQRFRALGPIGEQMILEALGGVG